MKHYSALTTIHPMWIPAAVKAAQQGNAQNLYRPPATRIAATPCIT